MFSGFRNNIKSAGFVAMFSWPSGVGRNPHIIYRYEKNCWFQKQLSMKPEKYAEVNDQVWKIQNVQKKFHDLFCTTIIQTHFQHFEFSQSFWALCCIIPTHLLIIIANHNTKIAPQAGSYGISWSWWDVEVRNSYTPYVKHMNLCGYKSTRRGVF